MYSSVYARNKRKKSEKVAFATLCESNGIDKYIECHISLISFIRYSTKA